MKPVEGLWTAVPQAEVKQDSTRKRDSLGGINVINDGRMAELITVPSRRRGSATIKYCCP